jgi:hypothetical protein
MELYRGSTPQFARDVRAGTLASKLEARFREEFRFRPADGEVRAWQSSLAAMDHVIRAGGLDDHGILIEYQLPLSSRRLDCMVTGHDGAGSSSAVIVELKQWDYVEPSWVEGCVSTFVGMRERDVLHPSVQAAGYRRYLADTNSAFADGAIRLEACSYLHNLSRAKAVLLHAPEFGADLVEAPVFVLDDADDLSAFLVGKLEGGEGLDVLEQVARGRFRPHKQLLEHTAKVIRHEPAWVLLDEQLVAFKAVLTKVRTRSSAEGQTVFLVRGGPGTGKSVVAINLVAALSEEGIAALHATGSRAFTENLRKAVGSRAATQFKYFNSFAGAEERGLDVLISDEAHRIREYSWNWRTPKRLRTETTQVEELMRAAKVSVFLIDDMQVVRPGEVGSSELIRGAAKELGIEVIEYELEGQFRCAGSEAFIGWVENTLDIRRTPNVLWDEEDQFEFRIVDSPHELEAFVRARAAKGFTARLTAGFCWPWSNPEPDGTLIDDVVIGDWAMPWNAKPDAGRLARGIPKSNYWASDPSGIEQVGCIYTAQGFEYEYAGVIFGRDLVYRPESGWLGQPEYSHDSIVKRNARADGEFTALVKSAYRVLLTRGLKGCAVYFQDAPTRDFVLARIER